jgi:hypothetical protein
MLRSVHEVVTNSTMGLLKSETRRGWYRRRIPRAYLPSERANRLTPSEALFGMVAGQRDDRAGADESVGYAGRLLIEDVAITPGVQPLSVARPRGGQPKPEHESFYFSRERAGEILGRKFYYHQQDYRRVMRVYSEERARATENRMVEAAPEGAHLSGRIRFLNLTELELATLIYALALEDGMAHKLGYGKPLGLGSVRITIAKLEVEPRDGGIQKRFLRYGPPALEDWTTRAPALGDQAKQSWLDRPNGRPSYAAFAAIARWPQSENFIYPDYGFFSRERGASTKTTLWVYQRRATLHPGAPLDAAIPAVQLYTTPTTAGDPQPAQPAVAVAETREPRREIDLRLIGTLEQGADQRPFVRGADGKRYLVTADSAAREVLRGLLDRLRAGESPHVRYRPDRQKVDGKNQNVALEVEAEKGAR